MLDVLYVQKGKNNLDVEPFNDMMAQLVEDIRERLVYRTHIFIKEDILGYKPAGGDLAYPDKLIMMEVSVHSTRALL